MFVNVKLDISEKNKDYISSLQTSLVLFISNAIVEI